MTSLDVQVAIFELAQELLASPFVTTNGLMSRDDLRTRLINRIRHYLGPLQEYAKTLEAAIEKHYSQKADDRCWIDDDELYAAAGLAPCDRRVGDKEEMLKNCKRFLEVRCEGGHWPSYADLEAENARLRQQLQERTGEQFSAGDQTTRPK